MKNWTFSYWRRRLCSIKISNISYIEEKDRGRSELFNQVKMAASRRTCQWPGCVLGEDGEAYQMMENLSTQELVLKDLEVHTSIHVARVFTVMGNNAMKLEWPTIKD